MLKLGKKETSEISMKKIVLIIVAILIIGCNKRSSKMSQRRELLKEVVVEHSKTDSAYRYYGCMKEVYRIYNCEYKVEKCQETRTPNMMYGVSYYLNRYGDTICIIYTDYTNYPRREE